MRGMPRLAMDGDDVCGEGLGCGEKEEGGAEAEDGGGEEVAMPGCDASCERRGGGHACLIAC